VERKRNQSPFVLLLGSMMGLLGLLPKFTTQDLSSRAKFFAKRLVSQISVVGKFLKPNFACLDFGN
jgi:hypothetical protein